ncbi:MAG: helix-turn-helix transcriptional regulator [Gaiellales bacterium]
MRGEPLKGHLDTMLLAALRDGPTHGYALVRLLEQRSEGVFVLGEGTVYPALRRLERAGLLQSGETVVEGRTRRSYGLTRAGVTALHEQEHDWNTFARGMAALLTHEAAT